MNTFAFLIFAGATLLRSATLYSVVDLGSFGGTNASGYSINNLGVAVGWSATPVGDYHAFANAGSLEDLNQVSSSNSYAFAINGSGQIAGTSYILGISHGTVWNGSEITDLGAGTYGMGINSSGQIAGTNGRAFVYYNGQFTDLGTISGGDWASAYSINDGGIVAGYGTMADGSFRAFTWTAATGMQILGTLGGGSSYALAINNLGEVAGHSTVSSGYEHAFVDTNGILTDLETLDGADNSYAYGINNSGVVVGYSGADAFLYRDGQISDLNSMIGPNSGWQLGQAYGINDAGQIVGSGTYEGASHAFLLNPVTRLNGPNTAVPEPDSAVLFGAGLGLLAVTRVLRAVRNL